MDDSYSATGLIVASMADVAAPTLRANCGLMHRSKTTCGKLAIA